MARRPTTADAYHAIAEPQRRKIISVLAIGELVDVLELNQPQFSKHLKVLKEVDLVSVRQAGKKCIYSLNAENLKPIHDWLSHFAHLWTERFNRLDGYLEGLHKEDKDD